MTAIDLSSYAGLTAMVLLTINVLLGLVLSTRYNLPVRWWRYGRRRIFDIHNWTAYVALALVFMHPLILLFSATAKFHVLDILVPLDSPGQRLYNCFGAMAFYLILLVVVTSYLRRRMSFRVWKAVHYAAYGAASLLFLHGIIIDPNLKQQPPDLLDGEKVLIEICLFLVLAGSLLRIRYALRNERPFATRIEFDNPR
ncbi:MAG: ferric reductase-like transmembrane domain-containing protein [Acidobacteriaceae bacterium]|nr:ferric reductase-like transmembrane domain-containing protein [Acidobacteriaceae bacterium]